MGAEEPVIIVGVVLVVVAVCWHLILKNWRDR